MLISNFISVARINKKLLIWPVLIKFLINTALHYRGDSIQPKDDVNRPQMQPNYLLHQIMRRFYHSRNQILGSSSTSTSTSNWALKWNAGFFRWNYSWSWILNLIKWAWRPHIHYLYRRDLQIRKYGEVGSYLFPS